MGVGGFGANLGGLTEGGTVMNLNKMPRFSAQICCSLFFPHVILFHGDGVSCCFICYFVLDERVSSCFIFTLFLHPHQRKTQMQFILKICGVYHIDTSWNEIKCMVGFLINLQIYIVRLCVSKPNKGK